MTTWIVFFTACAMQGTGFALLTAALSPDQRKRSTALEGQSGRLSDERRMSAAPDPVPVKACILLAAGSLLMLGYAWWHSHLILFAGQAIFSVFMALAIRRHHHTARIARHTDGK